MIAVAVFALGAVGCDSSLPTSQPASTPSTTLPATTAADSPLPSASDQPSNPVPPSGVAGSPGLLLSEVGFAHGSMSAFIELWNAGETAADLHDGALELDGSLLPFTADVVELEPGARFVIWFDFLLGQEPSPGAAHLLPEQAPRVAGGTLDLLDELGQPIDHVAWGTGPDPVRTGLGGIVPDALEADWTIGRAPGESASDDRLAWVPYTDGGSPGAANPLPAVPVLLPFSGAIFESATVGLTWYPAPGATGYRVQVAADQAFATIVRDEAVDRPRLTLDGMHAGSYFWRVQATGADGLVAAFTTPVTFEVVLDSADATTAFALTHAATDVILAAAEPDATRRLTVPLLDQHKDTRMLLLERNARDVPHAWDEDHATLDVDDPSDNMNCVLASVAMISAFACPTCFMSQDRIGYEVFKDKLPGPERDLNYGDGTPWAKIQVALDFALVTARSGFQHEDVPDRIWAAARAQIDAGKPLLVVRPNGGGGAHATVVTGYRVAAGQRTLYANDPWNGLVTYSIANSAAADPAAWWRLYPISGPLLGRQQELSVVEDTDEDGVVDFDETERFHTDPDNGDSDDDGVGDKEDILSSVFDDSYGYAVRYRARTAFPRMDGRDFDRDGLAPERDPDSDNGGCLDGDEDTDLDGIFRATDETWNFRADDDPCRPLSGGLQWTESYVVGSEESWSRIVNSFSLSVRLKPDPADPRYLFLDDGSSFSYHERSSGYVRGIGGCDDHTISIGASSGRFAPGDLTAGIVPEYEDGKDALGIGVLAEAITRGRHWNCLIDEPLTGTTYFTGDDFCWGLEDTDDGDPVRTFVFSCGETWGAGWFGRTWSLTGTVTLP